MRLYDLDAERRTVMIRRGKGNKDRMVPIGERAIAWIDKYLLDARPKLVVPPDDGTLILSHIGEAIAKNPLTEIVRDYVKASGIDKQGSCHLFRHTMATLMLEGGADTRFIQQMLGHADLSTTQIYTQVSIRRLQEIHAATHPGAKLERGETTSAAARELLSSLAAEEEDEDGDEPATLLEASQAASRGFDSHCPPGGCSAPAPPRCDRSCDPLTRRARGGCSRGGSVEARRSA